MATMSKAKAVGAGSVREALRQRYAAPAYAYLEEVGNATGSNCRRHADAVAMSLWPSRGLSVHGIEIKVARGDWLKELSDPDKAESVAKFCDFWWLAIGDAKIVQPGELPPTWGLLVFEGGKLKCAKEAPKLEAEALSRSFVAALFRRASESVDAARSEGVSKGWADGREAGKKEASDPDGLRRQFAQLRETVTEFEAKSGIKLEHWNVGRMGEAVARLTSGMPASADSQLDHVVGVLERSLKTLRGEQKAIAEALELQKAAGA